MSIIPEIENARKMHFTDDITLFFMLSMMGHDIIHDYGTGSDSSRWKNNLRSVQQFSSRTMQGGRLRQPSASVIQASALQKPYDASMLQKPASKLQKRFVKGDGTEEIDPMYTPTKSAIQLFPVTNSAQPGKSKLQSEPTEVLSKTSPGTRTETESSTARGLDFSDETDSVAENVVAENVVAENNVMDNIEYEGLIGIRYWKELITTKILLCFFYKFLFLYKTTRSTTIDVSKIRELLTPSDYSLFNNKPKKKSTKNRRTAFGGGGKRRTMRRYSKYIKFIQTNTNRFVHEFTNQISEPMEYDVLLNELINFMHTDSLDNIIVDYFRDGRRGMSLGGDGSPTQQTSSNANTPTNEEQMNNQLSQYQTLIEDIETTRTKLAAALDNEEFKDLFLNENPSYQQRTEEISEAINQTLTDTYKIKMPKSTPPYFPAQVRSNRQRTPENYSKYIKGSKQKIMGYFEPLLGEYTTKSNEIKKELRAMESGDLTTADKGVQSDFCEFVARSALFLNKICKSNGNIERNISNNEYLKQQVSILVKLANWDDVGTNRNQTNRVTKSLDDELINFFIKTTKTPPKTPTPLVTPTPLSNKSIETNGVCNRTMPNHVSNNAATSLPTAAKTKLVCSTSALIDGMPTCNYNADPNSATQLSWERGNMNFQLRNDANSQDPKSMYYQGKLTLDTSDEKKVTLELTLKTLSGFVVGKRKETSVVDESLKAYVALKSTLIATIQFIQKYIVDKNDPLILEGNIFQNLFNRAVLQVPSKNTMPFFKIFYDEILYKGVGDLFQEINSACKFGGYVSKLTTNSNNVDFNRDGNAIRFFVANDRPSGVRFAMMITHGRSGEINSGAFGGYYGDQKKFINARTSRRPCITDDFSRALSPEEQESRPFVRDTIPDITTLSALSRQDSRARITKRKLDKSPTTQSSINQTSINKSPQTKKQKLLLKRHRDNSSANQLPQTKKPREQPSITSQGSPDSQGSLDSLLSQRSRQLGSPFLQLPRVGTDLTNLISESRQKSKSKQNRSLGKLLESASNPPSPNSSRSNKRIKKSGGRKRKTRKLKYKH